MSYSYTWQRKANFSLNSVYCALKKGFASFFNYESTCTHAPTLFIRFEKVFYCDAIQIQHIQYFCTFLFYRISKHLFSITQPCNKSLSLLLCLQVLLPQHKRGLFQVSKVKLTSKSNFSIQGSSQNLKKNECVLLYFKTKCRPKNSVIANSAAAASSSRDFGKMTTRLYNHSLGLNKV